MGQTENANTERQYDALKYSITEFDKSIQYIASGALGISFAFIEKLVPLKDAHETWLLILSWILFAITIFVSLFCHFLSIMFNEWAIKNVESTDYEKGVSIRNKVIYFINAIMIYKLFIGLVTLIIFININL
jgi:hypothetical protein